VHSPSDTFTTCNGCHVLDPAGNAQLGIARPGCFGSDGRYSLEKEAQVFQVPHLRNLYGVRIGLDLDGDGALDGDELRAGSDPASAVPPS